MARSLNIEFIAGSWYIEAPSVKGNDILDISFGSAKESAGKIVYLFDHAGVHPSAIKDARDREMFKEMCDFHDITHDKHFTGSFIDALEYISSKFS